MYDVRGMVLTLLNQVNKLRSIQVTICIAALNDMHYSGMTNLKVKHFMLIMQQTIKRQQG